ncbi:enoyl-CoA hydratase [Alkalibacillus aidingensis]|uniref:enoyl-CoA hydratase n=1 Tax=Alkalibacillus aidingensis TaxID=2747607 RepID=UPI001660556F|nr:enoyl-CoA hydratase [Alkalibacillus aidingensis]
MSTTVQVHYDQEVATITLNRPEKMNALNEELLQTLRDKMVEVEHSSAKIVILTGEGHAFSAGGDLNMILQASEASEFKNIMATIKEIVMTFYQMPKLTISAINGAAAGLGLSLALAADYVIAKKDAKIAMNFIGIGLIPDGGGHFFMEQRLGLAKAKHVIWKGEKMTAEKALQSGIIDSIAEHNLQQTLNAYINYLQNTPILAMIESKKVLHEQQIPKLKAILDAETKGQLAMRQTQDHQEGIQAFLDKRKPNFTAQ